MSVEKHAGAAAEEIASWLRKECHLFPSVGNVADWARIISHHEQAAIDEATAPLKERIDELETLNQGYRVRCHSAERDAASSNRAIEQWKDLDAILRERLEKAKARIAELEGLGPLIEDLEREVFDAVLSGRDVDTDTDCVVTKTKIDAILKGGGS